ncbi:hypothetical protein PG993_013113 [Apiospora rasikravindrae]|uniref:Uncharacterized protein n=1 Tax=Apiospora rasikravindrae TaxID=990691 RepID=A0ABR1RWQ0_9PEZI
MNISCNNELQELHFPDTAMLGSLSIDRAPALWSISMSQWNGSADTSNYRVAQYGSLYIYAAPKLGRDASQSQLFNISALSIIVLDEVGGVQFPQLTSAIAISAVDSYAQFPKLETISNSLHIDDAEMGHSIFPSLKNAGKLTIGNRPTFGIGVLADEETAGPLPDLIVRDSIVIAFRNSGNGDIILNQVTTVGQDLNITNNSGIGKISFSRLTDVKRLNIINNPNSTVPGDFSRLTDANSIYINGVIEKYVARGARACNKFERLTRNSSTTLFPRLSSASDVRIEPWNPDFDCSGLVRLRDLGKIGTLACNGTNGTNSSSTGPNDTATSNRGLSAGTSAGIGTGVGIAVLGVLGALVWLIMRYRRRLRDLTARSRGGGDENKNPVEAAPKTPQEAGGRALPYQSGGGEIVEAGGTALRAEAGDVVASPHEVSAQRNTRFPVELA